MPSIWTTNPTPQASFSRAGSYRPSTLVGAAHWLLPDSAASIPLNYSWHKTKANRLTVKTPHVICFIFKKMSPYIENRWPTLLTVKCGGSTLVEKGHMVLFINNYLSRGFDIFLNRFPVDRIKASLGVYLPFLLWLLGGISRNEVIQQSSVDQTSSSLRITWWENTCTPKHTHDVWTLNFHECTKINCGGNSHRNWWKVKHNFTCTHWPKNTTYTTEG